MAETNEFFMEHDGALFKGFAPAWPTHVWDFRVGDWKPYNRAMPKGPEWGSVLTPAEFEDLKAEMAAEDALDLD